MERASGEEKRTKSLVAWFTIGRHRRKGPARFCLCDEFSMGKPTSRVHLFVFRITPLTPQTYDAFASRVRTRCFFLITASLSSRFFLPVDFLRWRLEFLWKVERKVLSSGRHERWLEKRRKIGDAGRERGLNKKRRKRIGETERRDGEAR